MNLWFTADLHLGHANIIAHCRRPFATVEEMDEAIIRNINDRVSPGDRLFIVGDFCGQRLKAAEIARYVERINLNPEQIVLVLGNHDDERQSRKVFPHVHHLYTVRHDQIKIVLCHYAMRTWNQSHAGRWHLYGHSHGTLPGFGKSFDVGVDKWDFKPLCLADVAREMEHRPIQCEDYHGLIRSSNDV